MNQNRINHKLWINQSCNKKPNKSPTYLTHEAQTRSPTFHLGLNRCHKQALTLRYETSSLRAARRQNIHQSHIVTTRVGRENLMLVIVFIS